MECVEADGLIYIREKPQNVPVELSELVDAITEPNDFLQIGSARAPDFDWEFPLVLSEQNQFVGTISPLIDIDEQLDAVGDFAGPWEQSQAFATIVPAATSTEENDEYGRPEEPGSDEQAASAPDLANEVSGKTKFVVLFLILGIVGSFFVWQEAQYNPPPSSSDADLAMDNPLIPNFEERAMAIKNARENSNLPSCPVDGMKDGCFGTRSFDDGDRYVGEFVSDKFNGWGVYLWPDGSFHVGNWDDYGRSGFGTRYYTDGKVEECEWVPDYTDMTASCK